MKMYDMMTDQMVTRPASFIAKHYTIKFFRHDIKNFALVNLLRVANMVFGYQKVDSFLISKALRRGPSKYSSRRQDDIMKRISEGLNEQLKKIANDR